MEIPERLLFEHHIWQSGVKVLAGVDEVGRGPLAGPVVAAAVVFTPYEYVDGVRDSKKLSEKKRDALSVKIMAKAQAYAFGIVDHTEIDRINIRQATFKAMRIAIGSLGINPEYLLIDGEGLPDKLYPQEALVKGDDRSFSIGAASILAKVKRDQLMKDYHEEFPLYGFDRHKGYGTAEHRKMIQTHGPCTIHRKSFLTKILGGKG